MVEQNCQNIFSKLAVYQLYPVYLQSQNGNVSDKTSLIIYSNTVLLCDNWLVWLPLQWRFVSSPLYLAPLTGKCFTKFCFYRNVDHRLVVFHSDVWLKEVHHQMDSQSTIGSVQEANAHLLLNIHTFHHLERSETPVRHHQSVAAPLV